MKDRIVMDNPKELKITLVKDYRINFKYEDQQYSLQWQYEEYEDSVNFNILKDNRWNYIDCVGYMDIHDLYLIKTNNNKEFKRNAIYKHVNKQYFLKRLHECGLIYAGDNIELEILEKKLNNNKERIEIAYKKYNEDIARYNISNDEIEENIKKITMKTSKEKQK